jgi:hypothetical protein
LRQKGRTRKLLMLKRRLRKMQLQIMSHRRRRMKKNLLRKLKRKLLRKLKRKLLQKLMRKLLQKQMRKLLRKLMRKPRPKMLKMMLLPKINQRFQASTQKRMHCSNNI